MLSTAATIKFPELLRLSGLLSPKTIETLQQQFPTETSTSAGFATLLNRRNLLTLWQTNKLLKGRYRGFFLGPYKLTSHLARGGMSVLYAAEHVETGEPRALKVLPPTKADKASCLPGFLREARIASQIRHGNVMKVFEVIRSSVGEFELNFMVMELLHGKDLFRLVSSDGPLPVHEAAEIIRQAAIGLHHIHQHGFVHRDIKPGNLFRSESGTVKIVDLGLASAPEGFDENVTQEQEKRVLGTADYLAPEQALDSHQTDARADIYSLGCTFYFLLTGQPPFSKGSLIQKRLARQSEEPKDIRDLRDDVPNTLQRLLKSMLEKQRSERIQSANAVAQHLSNWLAENPITDDTVCPLQQKPSTDDPDGQSGILTRKIPVMNGIRSETPTDSIRTAEIQLADSLLAFCEPLVKPSESCFHTEEFDAFLETLCEQNGDYTILTQPESHNDPDPKLAIRPDETSQESHGPSLPTGPPEISRPAIVCSVVLLILAVVITVRLEWYEGLRLLLLSR